MAAGEVIESRWVRLQQAIRTSLARKLLALVVLSLGTSALVMDHVRVPARAYEVGEVADRDIRATTSFSYVDWDKTLERQRTADTDVLPVCDFDLTLSGRLQNRISDAFDIGRRRYADALLGAQSEGRDELSPEELSGIAREFLKVLDLSMDPADLNRVVDARWDREVESLARDLIAEGMHGYVVADRSVIPSRSAALSVVRIMADSRDEIVLEDPDKISTLEEVRKNVALMVIERYDGAERGADRVRASLEVARAALRPNFSYNQLMTEDRRRAARESVSDVILPVQRGTVLVREGDVLDRSQVAMIQALQDSRAGMGLVGVLLALFSFSGLVYVSLYQFGAGFVRKFSTRARDVEAMAFILLMILAISRAVVEISGPLAAAVGSGVVPASFWYLAPIAGGAMLVRLLANSESALFWTIAAACLVGVMMEQQVFFSLFFLVSCVSASSALAFTKERVNVLRAGVQTGLVNAGAALLINLIQVHVGEAPGHTTMAAQPLWDVGFGFAGGLLSGMLALGLLPVFEQFGFVTDFKLLELANLNHPLLRQLMLRAPGTYHHSVTVASLCESAAESIGANALQLRVACYFHDIGKALAPRYFIENQGGGPNPHDRLPARTSARVIINHVVDGAAIARQYNLPAPIVDGIEMHHGTGIIQYFYAKAVEGAEPDEEVLEADFRYPGRRPNSRETGIMLLADKVEAACRTLKDPSAENIRALIQSIVNSSVTDGQLEDCPLTIQELYRVVDAFTSTLLGIYHHRIEYPGMPKRKVKDSSRMEEAPSSPIITLEMPSPFGRLPDEDEALEEETRVGDGKASRDDLR